MSIAGGDAWLPASMFLFGLDDNHATTGRPEAMLPLVSMRSWTLGWLSTRAGEGDRAVTQPLL